MKDELSYLVNKLERLICIKYPNRVQFKKEHPKLKKVFKAGLMDDWMGKEDELKKRISKLEKELNIVIYETCKDVKICNSETIYDDEHNETYCKKCGKCI